MIEWLGIIAFGFFSGVAASLGIGGGAILIIFLTLIMGTKQLAAQGINLFFFIPVAIFSVIIYSKKKLINLKQAVVISGFGLVGVLIGTYISNILTENILSKIFGGILLLISIKSFFQKKKQS